MSLADNPPGGLEIARLRSDAASGAQNVAGSGTSISRANGHLIKGGTHVGLKQSENTLNVSGYCRSIGGRQFAFVVMMTGIPMKFVPPDKIVSPGYALQHQIVEDLADYRGSPSDARVSAPAISRPCLLWDVHGYECRVGI